MSTKKVQVVNRNSAQSSQTLDVLYRRALALCLNFGEIFEQRKASEKESQEAEKAKCYRKSVRKREPKNVQVRPTKGTDSTRYGKTTVRQITQKKNETTARKRTKNFWKGRQNIPPEDMNTNNVIKSAFDNE